MRRLARLSDACRSVLVAAAVLGREFAFDVLRETADAGEDALIEALEEARDAQLIVELDARRRPGVRLHPRARAADALHGHERAAPPAPARAGGRRDRARSTATARSRRWRSTTGSPARPATRPGRWRCSLEAGRQAAALLRLGRRRGALGRRGGGDGARRRARARARGPARRPRRPDGRRRRPRPADRLPRGGARALRRAGGPRPCGAGPFAARHGDSR